MEEKTYGLRKSTMQDSILLLINYPSLLMETLEISIEAHLQTRIPRITLILAPTAGMSVVDLKLRIG